MDKLLRLSAPGVTRDAEDLTIYKPNLEAMDEEPDVEAQDVGTEDPSELMQLDEMQEPDMDKNAKKRKKRGDRAMKRSGDLLTCGSVDVVTQMPHCCFVSSSGMLEEMKAELLDAPEEQEIQGTRTKHDEEAAQKVVACLPYACEWSHRLIVDITDKIRGGDLYKDGNHQEGEEKGQAEQT